MSIELGQGHISVGARTDGMVKDIKGGLDQGQRGADSSGQSMGAKLAGGLGKTLKVGVIGAGAAVGGALAVSITKGMGRLTGIENAQSKLSGLGHSATAVTGIMDNALVSVKGTAFGLEDAASIAASAVAAGVKPGKDLERTLKLTGDAATIAGVSITEMGGIFGKVAASNKVQGDVINQLNDKGVPIVQLLGKELGKTADEVVKMSQKGQIGFESFQNAMESGLGGAALKSGETFKGALANMGAAAGRFGATLMGPFFNQSKSAFGGITDAVDNLNTRIKPLVATFDAWLTGAAIPKLKELGTTASSTFQEFRSSDLAVTSMARLGAVMESLVGSAQELWPAGKKIAASLGEASAAIGVSTWGLLLQTLEGVAKVTQSVLVPALDGVAGLMKNHQTVVTLAAGAWLAFKTIPSMMGRIAPAMAPISGVARGATSSLSGMSGAIRDSWRYAGQANPAISNMGRIGIIAGAQGREAMSSFAGGIKGTVSALGGLSGIAMMGAVVAIGGVAKEISNASRHNELLEKTSGAAAEGMNSLVKVFLDAGGKMGTEVFSAMSSQIGDLRKNLGDLAETSPGLWSQVTGAAGDVAGWFRGQAQAGTDAYTAQKKAAEGAGQAKKAFDELGWSNEQLMASVTGSAGSWENLKAQLLATGEGGQEAVDSLEALRTNYLNLQEATKAVTPGTMELGAALREVAESSGDAESKTKAYKRALDALAGGQPDLADAQIAQAEVLRDLTEATAEGIDANNGYGDSLTNVDGTLNVTEANGALLHERMKTLADTTVDLAAKGGDWQGSLAVGTEELKAQAAQMGITEGELHSILGQYRLWPDQISTVVNLDGKGEVLADLTTVQKKIDTMPDALKIPIETPTAEVRAELEKVGYAIQEIDGNPAYVNLIPKDDGVRDALNNTIGTMHQIANTEATATVGADTASFWNIMTAAHAGLADLGAVTAVPTVTADAEVFNAKFAETRSQLEQIDRTTVSPEIDVVIEKLLAGTGVSREELGKIDRTTAKPEVVAIIDEAMRRAQVINAELDKAARNRESTIRVNYWESRGQAANTQGPVAGAYTKLATGGRLPAYAEGGKLPTTGPGTDRVDGILGVDGFGQAVARVNRGEWIVNEQSSEKHDALLGAINRDDPALASLPAFADGGRLRDLVDGMSGGASRPLDGAPYVWGGTNWGDCSGAMSAPARAAVGLDPFGGRFATGNQGEYLASLGYTSGRGGPGDLRFGWFNGGAQGGHTAGTLPDGTNIEMGGGYGGGKVGGSVGADHPQFTNHAYLPIGSAAFSPQWDDLDNERQGGYLVDSRTTHTRGISDKSSTSSEQVTRMKTASELAKDGAGILVDGFFETLGLSGTFLTDPSKLMGDDGSSVRVTETVETVSETTSTPRPQPVEATGQQIAADNAVTYDPTRGVDQWTPVVEEALGRTGAGLGNLARTLEQIQIESGGDPNAVNGSDINAANGDPSVGLLQVIGSTFAAFRDAELPNDQRHPLANVTAAMNYARDRYGALDSIWPTAAGYYNGGPVTGGRGGIDDIPAWLTRDEFVVKRDAARANGPLLEAMNAGQQIDTGSVTYAPVFQGAGIDELKSLFDGWARDMDRKRMRANTSRRG